MKSISDYMTRELIRIPPDCSLVEAVELMRLKRVGSVVVEDKGALVGIFTERDVIMKVDLNDSKKLKTLQIKDIMTRHLKTVTEDESYIAVIDLMREHAIRHMPVLTKEGKLVGIVSLRDLLHRYQEYLEHLLMLKEQELNKNIKLIKESEARFRTIFTHSPVAITLTDKDERIIAWNPFAKELLGHEDHELINRSVSELYPPEEWRKIRAHNIRKIGLLHRMETKVIQKNGQLVDVDLSVCVLKNSSGQIIGSIGIMKDITEHKLVEVALSEGRDRALSATKAKAQFLADMSHEIRNPLNAILGFAKLLDKTTLTPQQREYLNTMLEGGDMLASIVKDIMDISKIEAHEVRVETIEFSLPELIRTTIEMAHGRLAGKDVRLRYECADDLPKYCVGDPTKIRQIIMNLIGNAIKFTEHGEIVLAVSCMSLDEEGLKDDDQTIVFSVRDTGIGIPPEVQGRIFNTFEQADSSISRRYGGSGLGLTISKALAEVMGGRMWLESTPGEGSNFSFLLKLTRSCFVPDKQPELPARGMPSPPLPQIMQDKTIAVLVAEDNTINQQLYQEVLTRFGFEVDIVPDGQAAVDRLKDHSYDVILMDLQMPIMDGYTATRYIREHLTTTTPIIALTANALEGEEDQCRASGMSDYLTKPIDIEQLREKIQEWARHG